MPAQQEPLPIFVRSDLILDGGWWETVQDSENTIFRRIHPPAIPLFEQLLAYLDTQPDPPPGPTWPRLSVWQVEARIIWALCIRWGSYFAVLADPHKPGWPYARQPDTSHTTDEEMARINLEASSALARWIHLHQENPTRARALGAKALQLLPLPRHWVPEDALSRARFLMAPAWWQRYAHTKGLTDRSIRLAYEQAQADPIRALANALIITCWRRNPTNGWEDLHAGWDWANAPLPLRQARIPVPTEQALAEKTRSWLNSAGFIIHEIQNTPGSLLDRVAPYVCYPMTGTYHEWSVTEETRQVVLPGREPTFPDD